MIIFLPTAPLKIIKLAELLYTTRIKNYFKKYIILPINSFIFTAELTAIRQAIRYCLEYENGNKFIIFTYSKSAVLKNTKL